jgi:hypothetical protein
MKGGSVLTVFGRSVRSGSSPRSEDGSHRHNGRDSENPGTNNAHLASAGANPEGCCPYLV